MYSIYLEISIMINVTGPHASLDDQQVSVGFKFFKYQMLFFSVLDSVLDLTGSIYNLISEINIIFR